MRAEAVAEATVAAVEEAGEEDVEADVAGNVYTCNCQRNVCMITVALGCCTSYSCANSTLPIIGAV